MERFAQFVIRHRLVILIITLLLTGFLIYGIKGMGFTTVLETTLPSKHPYVEVHKQFQKMFGGANTMMIVMESEKGDIFYKNFLEKLKLMTDEIKFHPDAITSQVISIAREKLKNIRGIEGGVDIRPFFEKGVPDTDEEINALRENVFSNESVRGTMVSNTSNAAMIIANFKDNINYQKLFDFFNKLKTKVEDEDIRVYISGRPSLLGWIYHNNFRAIVILVVSLLTEMVLLIIFLKHFHPLFIPIPLVLSILNLSWGFGVMGFAQFNLDPLGIVIPFVIAARVISHSIQVTERYGEHYRELGDKEKASVAVIQSMFIPSAASIITDAVGLFVLCIAPIPLLKSMGWICGLWLFSAILGVSILNPILFSYFPPPFKGEIKKDLLEKALESTGTWLTKGRKFGVVNRSFVMVLVIWIVVLLGSLLLASRLQVGDSHPGSPLLWPDSIYNQDDAKINSSFPGTNPLLVIMEGKEKDALKDPDVLRTVEAFQRDIGGCKGLGSSESLVGIVKKLNREFHEGDPKWSVIPHSKGEISFYLWMFESKSDPGDLDRWTDLFYQYGNIICYFKDHKGDTIHEALNQAKQFLSTYPIPADKVNFRLAGGIMGLTAATNEVVEKYADPMLWIALGVIFYFCVVPYRSFWRGVILIASLITANYVAMAYMALSKLGMTINALPVVSIGAGLGVDYGIYMLSRFNDELKEGKTLEEAIQNAFPTTGRAVIATGLTVIFGIIFWYFSALRFQAEMGFFLAFLLAINVLGALFLVPTLTYVVYRIKPAAILKNVR
ncbi:conserved membrane hypothetical protein [uncultured Desulfobacterium sp.]|uniref:Membrane transport protein MMPL domain-containing protein n=1 Tax=uncultured Desulfobacterium sp. TaxID=201089 RepID=A0A445MSQ1_9BACT|nr:conserved membrane hypothetical protein [uncultured Desulfobacterium sp.]